MIMNTNVLMTRYVGVFSSKAIHYHLMMNKGHISQAADSLCKRKYIIAIPDEADRRFVHYRISDTAQQIVEEIASQRDGMNSRILEGISEEELQIFRDVSLKIKQNIEKML